MSDSMTSKMITLKSSDGVVFVVPETVAKQSKMICHIIEDISTITFIPLPNVRAPTLAMVIEYCKKHVEAAAMSKTEATEATEDGSSPMLAYSRISDNELMRNWDMQFVDVDKDTLYDLIMAADYLHIEGLLDAACQKVADMITGKNPEMIRQIFNIKNDFTPKEEEEIRCENLWDFE